MVAIEKSTNIILVLAKKEVYFQIQTYPTQKKLKKDAFSP